MQKVKNILFIMADQLRWDYLSCYGHPHLHTPNIDALAEQGVRFERAYTQSPICGPSRMSTYTGRYCLSHGATWNDFPLPVGEMTMGDYLRPLGMRTALAGKTHMRADLDGMARLGIDPASPTGVLLSECGFEPFERDDGLHPPGYHGARPRYNDYLQERGYQGLNQWEEWANAAEGDHGEVLSGWLLSHSDRAARVREEDSETPYMTRRAMEFIDQAGDQPWCLHLSYIKPHWPYIAPEPYASLYGPEHVPPAVRSEAERRRPHPVYGAIMNQRVSRTFARDEVRERVVPAYMGLIKQLDDQLGVLFDFLRQRGRFDETMIVFTADHGDYLGDHWLGEKDLFHEQAVRLPLIIRDPRPQADATRGSVCDALVESIDLLPTFIQAAGGTPAYNRLEGRSLEPLLFGEKTDRWRDFVISEYDYSMLAARVALGIPPAQARLVMLADRRWKYIHAEGFEPMLFDLHNDPEEFHDLGLSPDHAGIREALHEKMFGWARRHHHKMTVTDEFIDRAARGGAEKRGIYLGYWDEHELPG